MDSIKIIGAKPIKIGSELIYSPMDPNFSPLFQGLLLVLTMLIMMGSKCWVKKIVIQKNLGLKSLVKIGSITAETLLKWINVTRTYFSWTYVTVSSVKDGPRNILLKFGQNQVSNNS